ncbi:hypothetical protein ACFPOF_03275 [Cohnella soli]|uniref:Flagellar protein FliT n=2 Tax=Cohnella soli TaxID=425005 RepID=A0ABW0HL38_9BACL
MNATLRQLHDVTVELTGRIGHADHDELVNLVELRESVLLDVQQRRPLPDAEENLLRAIAEHDPVIVARMEALREEAADELQKIAVTRLQQQKYQQSFNAESFFFDEKK